MQPNTVFVVETEKETSFILKKADKFGLKWADGGSYIAEEFWNKYRENICYNFFEGKYSTIDYCKAQGYKIIKISELMNANNSILEPTLPNHYKFTITNGQGETIQCNMFDIAHALDLSIEQFTALRYFRKKGDIEKQLNDTDKAIQCLEFHKQRLK